MTLTLLITAAVIIIILAVLTLEYSFLIPSVKGIPILMYHKVSDGIQDDLTVNISTLEEQFRYIGDKGYTTLSFSELKKYLENGSSLPRKPLILTFDDGYVNFLTYTFPLLKKYNFKATLFVPVAYIGKTNIWDKGNEPVLSAEQLKLMSSEGNIEIGLHSFLHRNYQVLAPEDIREDLESCFSSLNFYHIPFFPVLAYPYGGYPKKDKELMNGMKAVFRRLHLVYALRIGNCLNKLPLHDPYEMKRIDIKGTDSFLTFKIKLRKGRKKIFS